MPAAARFSPARHACQAGNARARRQRRERYARVPCMPCANAMRAMAKARCALRQRASSSAKRAPHAQRQKAWRCATLRAGQQCAAPRKGARCTMCKMPFLDVLFLFTCPVFSAHDECLPYSHHATPVMLKMLQRNIQHIAEYSTNANTQCLKGMFQGEIKGQGYMAVPCQF